MRGRPLPVPDDDGIYTFPDMLLAALDDWQSQLASLRSDLAQCVVELVAPFSGTSYLITERTPTGRPVLAVEPHHDDLVLSAGGYFLSQPRPLTVVTVFTRTNSTHPDVPTMSVDESSRLRAEESRQAFRPLQAAQHLLGLKDADPPYATHDPTAVAHLTDLLRQYVDRHPDAELIAPAAVTRHPDHRLVHEAARRLGCSWFWDDTSFYPTYAANVDDRYLFELRTGHALDTQVSEITEVALDKLILLHMYQSQMQPLREMYRVLRYNWTVARALRSSDGPMSHTSFGERFFRTTRSGSP